MATTLVSEIYGRLQSPTDAAFLGRAEYESNLFQKHVGFGEFAVAILIQFTKMSLTNAGPKEAARAAKISSRKLATLSTSARNDALDAVHDALANARQDILAANGRDMELAKKAATNGELKPTIVKRLDLSRKGKFDDMLQGIKDVRELNDPGRSRSLLCHSAYR